MYVLVLELHDVRAIRYYDTSSGAAMYVLVLELHDVRAIRYYDTSSGATMFVHSNPACN
jgi:hypothetical protein